jgi:Trm5-related predicted tRNA methylase
MRAPRDFLADFLLAKGYDSIRSSEHSLNRLAIKLHRGRLGIIKGEFRGHVVEELAGVKLLSGAGDTVTGLRADKRGKRIDLKIDLEFPKIVIDYGLWDYHTDLEKRLLLRQSDLALQVVRDHLWDRNLVPASCPLPVAEFFADHDFFGDVLTGKFPGEAVLLDPNAPDEIKQFSKVPDRLNLLVEIICRNLAGVPLRKAIQQSRS